MKHLQAGGKKNWINVVKVFKARGEMRGISGFADGAEEERQLLCKNTTALAASCVLPLPVQLPTSISACAEINILLTTYKRASSSPLFHPQLL